MKKYLITFTIAIFGTLSAMVVTSCGDNVEHPEEENLTNTSPSITTPTTDALTTKSNVKAYVFEGDYGEVGKKIIDRLTNRQSALDSTAQLYLFTREGFSALSDEEHDIISAACRHGAKVLIDRYFDPTLFGDSQSQADDEIEALWGFNNTNDMLFVDTSMKDSLGNTLSNRPDLNDYEYGLYADEATKWINLDQRSLVKSKIRSTASRADSSTDMADILQAQTDTWVTSASVNKWSQVKGKSVPYTIFTTIYAVHRFDDDKDYFLCEQTITGNNTPLWKGEWSATNYTAHFDNYSHSWRFQGLYANDWTINNYILNGDYGSTVTLSDGLALVKHSPVSTNGSTTMSTSTTWNITGSLGGTGAIIGTAISGTVGSSQTLADIETIDKCMEGDDFGNNNASWQYHIDPMRQIKDETHSYSFNTPPSSAIKTFSCEQTWLYELSNASRYTELTMFMHFYLSYYCTLLRNPFPFFAYSGYERQASTDIHSIRLILPKHTK